MLRILAPLLLGVALFAGSIEDSAEVYKAVFTEEMKASEKVKLAQNVWENPGDYDPRALIASAAIFLEAREIEKSARLWMYGRLRMAEDREIVPKGFRSPIVFDLLELLEDIEDDTLDLHWSQEKEWDDINYQALYDFVSFWDAETPRNYDVNWVLIDPVSGGWISDPVDVTDQEIQAISFEIRRSIRIELMGWE